MPLLTKRFMRLCTPGCCKPHSRRKLRSLEAFGHEGKPVILSMQRNLHFRHLKIKAHPPHGHNALPIIIHAVAKRRGAHAILLQPLNIDICYEKLLIICKPL